MPAPRPLHGVIEFSKRDRILMATVRGPINLEALQESMERYAELLSGLGPGPIAELTDLREFAGTTADVYETQGPRQSANRRTAEELGLRVVAEARVYKQPMFEQIARLHGLIRDPETERSFTDFDAAMLWLAERLAIAAHSASD